MPLFNKNKFFFENRNKIAYLGALTLLFSYAELFIPKVVPFFRLGLANVAVLMGLSLSPSSFLFLLFIKAFCSSMMAGTLYTPFFLISLLQSAGSGMAMYLLARINEIQTGAHSKAVFSIYGISIFGSAISAVIQIGCSYVYLGAGTLTLLGPMLIFSLFSGFITALLVMIFEFPQDVPVIVEGKSSEENQSESKKVQKTGAVALKVSGLFIGAIIIFTLDSWKILLPVMIFCLILQRISGRKILLLPYILLWIFIIISCLLVPQGKVIYSFWKIRITYGALMEGVTKAMILTSVSALSQCMAGIRFSKKDSFIALVFLYYQRLQKAYEKGTGNIFDKLKTALSAGEL